MSWLSGACILYINTVILDVSVIWEEQRCRMVAFIALGHSSSLLISLFNANFTKFFC